MYRTAVPHWAVSSFLSQHSGAVFCISFISGSGLDGAGCDSLQDDASVLCSAEMRSAVDFHTSKYSGVDFFFAFLHHLPNYKVQVTKRAALRCV